MWVRGVSKYIFAGTFFLLIKQYIHIQNHISPLCCEDLENGEKSCFNGWNVMKWFPKQCCAFNILPYHIWFILVTVICKNIDVASLCPAFYCFVLLIFGWFFFPSLPQGLTKVPVLRFVNRKCQMRNKAVVSNCPC